MKKNIFLPAVITALVLLPGCWGRKKQRCTDTQDTNVCLDNNNRSTGQQVAFFDDGARPFDETESFVLDDEIATKSGDMVVAMGGKNTPTPKNVKVLYFDYDSTKVRQDQKQVLKDVQYSINQWVKEGRTVAIKGHSCDYFKCPRSYNFVVANNRAQEVAKMCHIPTEQCRAFGVGNEEPAITEQQPTKEGQSNNRRVEIYPV